MITHLFAPTKKRAENNAQHARTYLHGLLSETPRKNSEAIADAAGDTESQDLQNFIADSQWEEAEVFRYAAGRANERLGNHPDAMLALDESCFSKKGRHSACVARQYNGRLGKIDSCQVGVFSSLTNGTNAVLVGTRLLVPDEWVQDPERCLAAGIPADRIKTATKTDLARELIEEADTYGVIYARVGIDSFYGRDTGLLCWLDDRGTEFYADTPANTSIWLEQPESGIHPDRPGQHGELKYTLSNAPATTLQATLAKHQGQRHFIERNFQNSKSHLGMADYQVRKWRAWHRHMAMVALAGLFVMEERLYQKSTDPLLSTRDVVQILDWYFRSNPTLESVVEQIERRHHRRKRASASKFKTAAENEKKIRKTILTV
jgi:SRSO17 transposase